MWKEELRGYEIGQVRADDIERVLMSLQEDGFAARTVSFYRSTIRQIMQRAVGRVIASNPVDLVQLTQPGQKAEQRRALSEEEQGWIWDTPHRAQPVAVIMMLSGLRRGELAALTWADVDLDTRTITINKTMEYPPGQRPKLRHLTKSAAGMRTVDIPQKLAEYMAQMPKDSALVIHTTTGQVMTATAWEALWKSYMRVLNIKYGTRTPADLEKRGSSFPLPGLHLMCSSFFSAVAVKENPSGMFFLDGFSRQEQSRRRIIGRDRGHTHRASSFSHFSST